ncbi:hypothetical protein [Pantoea sp. A4]|uniref:hypothetical protein n=1 Tax=Pantoea sp. A4 TaxID=1225184 RepID=UPI0004747E89|nr:hypothetical protein [Pantoea sp. A4]
MRSVLFAVLGAVALTGCTSPIYNYAPQAKSFSIPPLNTSTTTYVGEEMVKQGIDSSSDAIHFEQPTQIGNTFYYIIPAGDYAKVGQENGSEFYSGINSRTGTIIPNRPMINDPVKNIQVKNSGEICIITIFNATKCDSGKIFSKVKLNSSAQSSFQQTLLYNGKVGSKINIGYREYSGGLARPAFSNEVEYDLSDSKTIRYKGAILEITDANNQSITFKLTKNFNTQ